MKVLLMTTALMMTLVACDQKSPRAELTDQRMEANKEYREEVGETTEEINEQRMEDTKEQREEINEATEERNEKLNEANEEYREEIRD